MSERKMGFVKRWVRDWLEVPEEYVAPVEMTDDTDPRQYVAQDAGDVLGACERRLADDAVLLALCLTFEKEHGPRFSMFGERPPLVPQAYDAVCAERKRVELRIAEATLIAAKNAVKVARTEVTPNA